MLQVLCEEAVDDDSVTQYFHDLYKIVCVGERPGSGQEQGSAVRTTYVVDWEQLVHLLEEYRVFGEDIVEVQPISAEEAQMFRNRLGGGMRVARA